MFATVKALPCDETLRGRLRRRFASPALSCSRVTLPNFFSFYHIQVPNCAPDALPWEEIAETAGTLKTRLLLPRGVAPAPDAPVRVFLPQKLPLRFLCNSALHALGTLALDPVEQTLCLVDPQGAVCDLAVRFAPFAARLRVVTDALDVYEKTAARLRDRFGLSLLLSPNLGEAEDSTILLLEDEADAPALFAGLVFTNRPCARMNAQTLTPDEAVLPPEYAALCPPEIDPLLFASAAYELCAADELGDLWAACAPRGVTAAAATPADRCCPGWQT